VNTHLKTSTTEDSISSNNYWNEKQHFTMQTNGSLPTVGNQAPDFNLTNSELETVTLATYAGKRKILNILPSLDVPICMALTRKLNDESIKLENTVLLTISADLPFTQRQFCESENLNNVVTLSTFRSTFAADYGVQIIDGKLTGLMAQAVVVLDEQNSVIHTQIATELAEGLDFESIITALKPLSVTSHETITQPNNRRESFRVNPLESVRTPCYCKIKLPTFNANGTAEYKRAYVLATNKIYEELKSQRHSIATVIPDIRIANIMLLNLRDISATGCSMFNHDEAFSYFLVLHKTYKNCTLHMPDGVEIQVSLKIVLKHHIEHHNTGKFNEIIGVEFIDMTQSVESSVSYYVREIERQHIALRELESVLESNVSQST